MYSHKAMLSVLHLFAVFFFFASAMFFYALFYLPTLRLQILDAVSTSPQFCLSLGSALMGSSLLLTCGFYFLYRERSLILKMGGGVASVNVAVIQKTLEECLDCHFKGKISLSGISIGSSNKLEIEVFLRPFEEGLREELFVSVQTQIAPLLRERFGYSHPFHLIATLEER